MKLARKAYQRQRNATYGVGKNRNVDAEGTAIIRFISSGGLISNTNWRASQIPTQDVPLTFGEGDNRIKRK